MGAREEGGAVVLAADELDSVCVISPGCVGLGFERPQVSLNQFMFDPRARMSQ